MNDTYNLLLLDSNKIENNKYKLDNTIKGLYKLVSFVSTNNMYNVNDTNNKIYLDEFNGVGFTSLETTLDNGFYDSTDLTSHLSSKLNNICTGSVSVSFNDNTRKFTITNTLNFYFTFGSNTSNSSRKILGFNEQDGTSALSQTSNNVIDLNTCKNIFITITEDNNRDIKGIDFFNSSFLINGVGSFGEVLRYVDSDNFHQYVNFRNVKTLHISFIDNNNNTLDLNSEYQIILKKMK